jgi:hypothetical protein
MPTIVDPNPIDLMLHSKTKSNAVSCRVVLLILSLHVRGISCLVAFFAIEIPGWI